MAREALQLQLDNLRWTVEQLEVENARLRDDNPGNAALLDLRAEVEQYKEENSCLVARHKGEAKGPTLHGPYLAERV